jgi:ferredoxin-type protein NapF
MPDESVVKSIGTRNRFRLPVRLICVAAAVLCLLPVGDKAVLLQLVPALSSFVAFASILSIRAVQPIFLLGLIAGIVAFFRHRWFCRWVCPMGLCLDGASHLGRRLKRKPSRSMSIGPWLLALTLGGTILAYPLFLWCDPLALFSGIFLLTERHQALAGAVSFLVVMLLLVLSVFWPHVWCRGLCPLGAFQDLLSQMARSLGSILKPARGRLKMGDGRRALATPSPIVRPSSLMPRPSSVVLAGHPVARRTLLGLAAGAAVAGLSRLTGREVSPFLRPPGAVDELTFKGLCTRCGNCLRSCPYGIIHRETGRHGIAGFLTPVLSFNEDYCREDCTRCTRVCPSGALASLGIGNKPQIRIGLARVDMSICLLGEDRECSACMRWCPYSAIRYVFSQAEYTLVPVIDADKCNGCGACEVACPTSPDKAIRIIAQAG